MMTGSVKKKKRGGVRLLEHVRLLGRIRYDTLSNISVTEVTDN